MPSGRRALNLVADFETTTSVDDCRVWGWAAIDIDGHMSPWNVKIDNDIDSFIEWISGFDSVTYFHNLRFDGSFIIDKLFRLGFSHNEGRFPNKGQFTTFINNMGQYYTITVKWANGMKTEFRDSLKKLNMDVASIAKAFKLNVSKGEIEYTKHRPVGYVMTREEREYIVNDVMIVAQALKTQFDAGLVKLTLGSDALAEYKTIMGKKTFERYFPILSDTLDKDIRLAYRGGFTYADERFRQQLTCPGMTLDVNSLYPSVMYNKLLPYGEPVYAAGLPKPTKTRPLFIVSITFTAKLKKDHIPCIQVKGSNRFASVEYQKHIKEPVTLACTNVDLDLWREHYDMDIISYNGGWLFKGTYGLFDDYIEKWSEIKANSTGGMRTLAKNQLNNLYGKFATNPDVTPKVPIMRDNRVKLVMGEEDTKNPVYTAMGVFITAYARDITIRAAQANYGTFAYADTDSLHLLTLEMPSGLDIDPVKLGAWKHEYNFQSAFYVRAKSYIELKDSGEYEVHIAGLNADRVEARRGHPMTFDDFHDGAQFHKLKPSLVPGGTVLTDTLFTLKF